MAYNPETCKYSVIFEYRSNIAIKNVDYWVSTIPEIGESVELPGIGELKVLDILHLVGTDNVVAKLWA